MAREATAARRQRGGENDPSGPWERASIVRETASDRRLAFCSRRTRPGPGTSRCPSFPLPVLPVRAVLASAGETGSPLVSSALTGRRQCEPSSVSRNRRKLA